MYSLTFLRYVAMATKPVTRLQIRPIVHNLGHPLPLPQVTSGSVQYVGMQPRTDTHTHTHTDRHTEAGDHNTFRVVYDSREM